MPKHAGPETDKLTIDLTDVERAHLDALALKYGRLGAGAFIRLLIAERWESESAIRVVVGGQLGAASASCGKCGKTCGEPSAKEYVVAYAGAMHGPPIPLAVGNKISFGKKTKAEVEAAIARASAELKEMQTVAEAPDYKTAGAAAPAEVIERFSTVSTTVKWAEVCKAAGLEVPQGKAKPARVVVGQ